MAPFLQIDRYPYEEPYNLRMRFRLSNGSQLGDAEIYVGAQSVEEWGCALSSFPKHRGEVYLWEAGSERAEDRWAYYMRLRCFLTDSIGHCALHIRFNNNQPLPDTVMFEFCIPVEPAALNRLGTALSAFARLEHEALLWTSEGATLFRTRVEAEQSHRENTLPLPLQRLPHA